MKIYLQNNSIAFLKAFLEDKEVKNEILQYIKEMDKVKYYPLDLYFEIEDDLEGILEIYKELNHYSEENEFINYICNEEIKKEIILNGR